MSTALHSHLHPTPSWNHADHGVPTGREETWRFTPLTTFGPLFALENAESVDWQIALPEPVTTRVISADQARELSWDAPVDIVASNAARAEAVQVIEVPAEVEVAEPLTIDVHASGTHVGHLIVRVGHHAKATCILKHTGTAHFASKVEVHAEEGAQVDVVSLQDWQADAVHGGQFSVKVGAHAQVRTIQASIGAGQVRIVERAEYDGDGGRLEQLGLYFVRGAQHVEHRLFVDHNAPHTESYVDYRGALQDRGAHSVWIGDVLIRAQAKDIETYETNKNLMLTDGCQADSVPNLEIETGQIRGAGHSSSTGRFDEEQLFYLRSRGIPEDQARRLIVEGFFLDIIRRIGVPDIEARLTDALNEQLSHVAGLAHDAVLGEDA